MGKEFIKILKYPLIIITLYFTIPTNMTLSNVLNEISVFIKNINIEEISFNNNKIIFKKIEEKAKEIKEKITDKKQKTNHNILNDINELLMLNNQIIDNQYGSNIMGELNINKNEIKNIFGTLQIYPQMIYTLKKDITIYESNGRSICLANPNTYIIKSGKNIFIKDILYNGDNINILLSW